LRHSVGTDDRRARTHLDCTLLHQSVTSHRWIALQQKAMLSLAVQHSHLLKLSSVHNESQTLLQPDALVFTIAVPSLLLLVLFWILWVYLQIHPLGSKFSRLSWSCPADLKIFPITQMNWWLEASRPWAISRICSGDKRAKLLKLT
jgi:hypothetical protein